MLNAILWLPLAVGLLVVVMPRRLAPWIASAGALATLGLAVWLIADFTAGAGLQHTVDASWIPQLGIRYQLGIDGISLFLVALTALLWAGSTVWAGVRGEGRDRIFWLMLAIGETATLGAFLAQDLILFVLFFDLMLVPFWFLIGVYGQGARVAATTKMIVYTLVGSLLMLVAAIATGVLAAGAVGETSFALADLGENVLAEGSQRWIFWLFALAFLVKMPAFPLHGWMPDAYRSAPLPVLALLSAVLSKVGAYGFLRIVFPLYPDAAVTYQEVLVVLGLASIIYGSVMAFNQTNVRLIAGYSSIAQLGFVTVGLFSLRPDGADGAVLQMVNHGLVVAPIFLIVALLAERARTEDIRRMGGLAMRAPVLAAMFLIVIMATLAIPGSANFIGELYILYGLFEYKVAYAVIGALGVALAAFYALRLYQRTMNNRLPRGVESRELSRREGLVLVPLVGCIVALALHPGFILSRGEADVAAHLAAIEQVEGAEVAGDARQGGPGEALAATQGGSP